MTTLNTTDPVIVAIHYTLSYSELIIQFASIVTSCAFSIALYRVHIFHNNLRILLFNHMLVYLVVIVTRIILSVFTLTATQQIFAVTFIYVTGLYCCGLNFIVIILERGIAFWYVNRYEHMFEHIPLLGLLFAISGWYSSFAIVFLCWKGYIGAALVFYALAFLYIAAVTVFIGLLIASRKRYENRLKRIQSQGHGHSLTDRYQLTENVRSARMLTLFMGTTSFFTTIVVLLAFLFFLVPAVWKPPVYDLFAISLALNSLLAPIAGILSHEKLKLVVKQFISNKAVNSSVAFEPKSLNGKRLILGPQESRQIYFDMFEKTLNGPPRVAN